jgi:hypothetical protein
MKLAAKMPFRDGVVSDTGVLLARSVSDMRAHPNG